MAFLMSKIFVKRTNPLIIYQRNFHTSSSSLLLLKTASQLSEQRKQLSQYGNKPFVRNVHFLQPLPYSIEEDLTPLFSAETLRSLYEHQGFLIDNLNKLTKGDFFILLD